MADAVRGESNQAVCHWWGVIGQTVTKWHKALGVGSVTDGTHRLRSEYALTEKMDAAREKAHQRAREPEARAKLAAAKRGKPRPAHVRAILANGRKKAGSDKANRKRSEANRRNGHRPPVGELWTPEEDEMVRTLPPTEAAERTGRTRSAIAARRRLGLPDAPAGREVPSIRAWTPEQVALLGTMHDDELAGRIGKTTTAVRPRRRVLGVAAFGDRRRKGP